MQSRKFESLKCSVKIRDILVSCHLLRSSNFNSNNDIIEINMVQHLINSFSKEQIKIRRKKNRKKYPNNRLMNLILETLPSFSVPWDFYYFSPEERKQSDHRVTNHRDSRRKNEHSRRKGRSKAGAVVVAASRRGRGINKRIGPLQEIYAWDKEKGRWNGGENRRKSTACLCRGNNASITYASPTSDSHS